MPETIDLLLKELKRPAFIRYYQRHQEQGYGYVRYLSGHQTRNPTKNSLVAGLLSMMA